MLRFLKSLFTAKPFIAVALLGLALVPCMGDDCGPTFAVRCVNVEMHDGDTAHCDLECGFGLTIRDKSIRAAGYDAWEINRTRQTVHVTDIEIERGKQAKAALENLISRGELFAEDTGKADPYGRLSAYLWVRIKESGEWVEVAKFMRRNHHCRD